MPAIRSPPTFTTLALPIYQIFGATQPPWDLIGYQSDAIDAAVGEDTIDEGDSRLRDSRPQTG